MYTEFVWNGWGEEPFSMHITSVSEAMYDVFVFDERREIENMKRCGGPGG